MTTPSSVIEYDMVNETEQLVLKEQEVMGGKFDKLNYTSLSDYGHPQPMEQRFQFRWCTIKTRPLSQRTPQSCSMPMDPMVLR